MESQPQRRYKPHYSSSSFDFKNGKALVSFINKIPNLQVIKFKLSEEEEDVVGDNSNLIVIGRSGTGKTTCALMRMFAIEIIFKNMAAKTIIQSSKDAGKQLCKSQYLQCISGLKTIFLTASPFLITQIRLRYEELKQHVKKQLKNKEIQKNLVNNQGKSEKVEKAKTKTLNQKMEMNKMEEKQEEMKNRQLKFTSFNILSDADYPGFFSIREFLIMLDGSLRTSFYVRNNDRSRVQEENYGKNRRNQKFKTFKVHSSTFEDFALECDWYIFSEYFWPTVSWKKILKMKRYHNQSYRDVTAIATWTQIITTIKGSCEAHTFQEMYLPLDKYLEQSQNIHYGRIEKQTMYELFMHYNQWKNKANPPFYDFMDFSNHILKQIKKAVDWGYTQEIIQQVFGPVNQIPDFNYLFLDEVQDLPPAVIYLISLVFSNGVYYSGDTAQAIRKGVAFKFSDISLMFRNQFPVEPLQLKAPYKYSLTVNFRSHNQILSIANNIVKVIQLIFPDSIDSMKKQSAKRDGPRPIVLNKTHHYFTNQQVIKNLLLDAYEKQFSCQQTIIVRNEQDKRTLTKQMEGFNALILTVEQCKGLEYNDVVVYNFFNPALKQKWKILKYIDLYPQRGTKKFYLEEIDNISQYSELIQELKMLYTIFTRARCTLILYDHNLPEQFEYIWNALGLIESNIYSPPVQQKIKGQIQKFKQDHLSTGTQTWETKGFRFYVNKQYKLAINCYQRIGMVEVVKKIEAVMRQQQVQERLHNLQVKYQIKKWFYELYDEDLAQIKQWKPFKNQCQLSIYPEFERVARKFEELQIYQDAADCYYEAENYRKALQTYRKCKKIKNLQAGICCQKEGEIAQAAQFYQKCGDYTRMMLCLEKHNHYEICIKKLKQSQGYPHQQHFFRKYSIILIQRIYKKIDKKQQNDGKYFTMSQRQTYGIMEQLRYLTQSQQLLQDCKSTLVYLRKEQIPKYSKYIIEESILEQLQWLKQKDAKIKIQLSVIERYSFQGNAALTKMKAQLFMRGFNILIIRSLFKDTEYDKDSIWKNIKLSKKHVELIYNFVNLSQCINKLKMKKNKLQTQHLRINSYKMTSETMKLLENLQTAIKTTKNIKIFNPKFISLYFSNLYSHDKFKQMSQNIIKQIIEISSEMFKKIDALQEQIQEYITTPILNFNNIRPKKKKTASYSYLQNLYKDNQNIIPKKRYLPPIAFIDQLIPVVDQFETLYKKYFLFAFKQQYNTIRCRFLYDIYETQAKNIEQNTYPYNNFKLTSGLLQQQAFKQIKNQYLSNQTVKTTYNQNNHELLEQRLNLKNQNTVSHHYLSQVAISRDLQLNLTNQNAIQLLQSLSLVTPRTYIYFANVFGLKQTVINAIIWHLSYKSTIYVNKAKYDSLQKHKVTQQDFAAINLLNPHYFNFEIARTKYRRGNAADEIIEGAFLLGFCEQISKKLTFGDSNFVKLLFFKQDILCRIYMKEKANILSQNYDKKSNQNQKQIQRQMISFFGEKALSEIESTIEINQFMTLDKWHEDSIFDKPMALEIKLQQNEIQEINHKVNLKLTQAIKQLESFKNQQTKICDKMINAQRIYEKERKEVLKNRKLIDLYKYPQKSLGLYKTNLSQKQELANLQDSCSYYLKQLDYFLKKIQKITVQKAISRLEEVYLKKLKIFENKIKKVNPEENTQKWMFQMTYQISKPVEIDVQQIENCLKKIINSLWKSEYIKTKAKCKQFEDLRDQICEVKQSLDNLDQDGQNYLKKMEEQFKEFYNLYQDINKQNKQIKTLQEKIDKFQKRKNQYQSQQYINKCKKKKLSLKKKNKFTEYRQTKISQSTETFKIVSSIIRSIFHYEQTQYLAEQFYKNIKNLQSLTNKQRLNLVLFYLAFQNYKYFKDDIKTKVDDRRFGLLEKTIDKVKYILENALQDQNNLKFLQSIFELNKCRLITDQPCMGIFKYFVIVKKTKQSDKFISDLLKKTPNLFCYYIDQKRQTMIMKFTDILPIIEKKMKMKFENYNESKSLISRVLLLFRNAKKQFDPSNLEDRRDKMIQTIQANRCQLFTFFGDHEFISHQSSLFIYHQLKTYADLLTLACSETFNLPLAKIIQDDIDGLEKQFKKWMLYAEKFELPFRRGA